MSRCAECGAPLPRTITERIAHADRHAVLNLRRRAVALCLAAGWNDLAEEGMRRLEDLQPERKSA